jgi:hypothetical protein
VVHTTTTQGLHDTHTRSVGARGRKARCHARLAWFLPCVDRGGRRSLAGCIRSPRHDFLFRAIFILTPGDTLAKHHAHSLSTFHTHTLAHTARNHTHATPVRTHTRSQPNRTASPTYRQDSHLERGSKILEVGARLGAASVCLLYVLVSAWIVGVNGKLLTDPNRWGAGASILLRASCSKGGGGEHPPHTRVFVESHKAVSRMLNEPQGPGRNTNRSLHLANTNRSTIFASC